MSNAKLTGRIKKPNSRGFGFIETAEGIDFFFHYSSFDGDWKKMLSSYLANNNLVVEFENDPTTIDGPKAKNVKIIGTESDR